MSNHLNKLTEKKYSEMTNRYSKKSGLIKDCFFAFVFGGLICIIAQLFHDIIISSTAQKIFGTLTEENAKALTVMFMVFVGVLLTAFNVYDEIGNIAGAGTIVPITGFANSITSPAMEYKSEGFILGVGAQMFQVAGPVIVYGTAASVIAGFIYYLIK
ncbi:MAG: SpoVA/SpoVAEb family sporulation membrane protein [Clostridia bacterium]|jgi:stage V sporulation protein AC|nr:SpoVA/SpoVAEb family sporulation membrane protein [Clostridia bacterium]